MRGSGRAVAFAALVVGVAVLAVVVLGGHDQYTVHARFISASQMVKGGEVKIAGERVGTVSAIKVTPDWHADHEQQNRPANTSCRPAPSSQVILPWLLELAAQARRNGGSCRGRAPHRRRPAVRGSGVSGRPGDRVRRPA